MDIERKENNDRCKLVGDVDRKVFKAYKRAALENNMTLGEIMTKLVDHILLSPHYEAPKVTAKKTTIKG